MNDPERFSVPEHVMAADLEGEAVLLNLHDKRYVALNETAALAWRTIERGEGRAEIVAALRSRFGVPEAVVAGAVDALLADLAGRGLIVAGEPAPAG